MSDFLGSLVDRSHGAGPMLRPRFPSRFESMRAPVLFAGESVEPTGVVEQQQAFETPPRPAVQSVVSPASSAAPSMENHRPPFAVPSIQPYDPSVPAQSPRVLPELPDEQDRPGRFAPASESPFDPRRDPWLGRRLDDLSRQLWQLRGAQVDSRDTSPHPCAPPGEFPTLVASDSAPPKVAVEPRFIREISEDDDATSTLAPVKPNSPVGSLAPQPQRRESRDELPGLFAAAQMQPAPRIIPEDLPAISKHSAPPQPTINVTIGRVEVKATRETPAPKAPRQQVAPAVMSLQDYLQRRATGGIS